jgi:hypothetical protein
VVSAMDSYGRILGFLDRGYTPLPVWRIMVCFMCQSLDLSTHVTGFCVGLNAVLDTIENILPLPKSAVVSLVA